MGDFAGSGIPELDKLLGGGMMKGHNYLLEVESGVQELTFVSAFLKEGLRQREVCGIVLHDLPSAEIIHRFADIGFDLKKELDSGSFIITDLWTEGKYEPEGRGPILVTDNPTDTNSALRLFTDMATIGTEKIREGSSGIRSAYISMSSEIMVLKFEPVYKMTRKAMRFVTELSALSLVVFHPKMFEETVVSAIEQLFGGIITLTARQIGNRYLRFVRVKQSPAGSFDMDEHRYDVTDNRPIISI
jgi:KaiC/GvpD/RAD55 family RecA-like ATPase